jgi:iron(III) transport system ATP-binding protein
LGPLALTPQYAVKPGPVKVAIRPEAWSLATKGHPGLPGVVAKTAYLGSFQELTVDTSLGQIFIMSSDVGGTWPAGQPVVLQLSNWGVSVVAA